MIYFTKKVVLLQGLCGAKINSLSFKVPECGTGVGRQEAVHRAECRHNQSDDCVVWVKLLYKNHDVVSKPPKKFAKKLGLEYEHKSVNYNLQLRRTRVLQTRCVNEQ